MSSCLCKVNNFHVFLKIAIKITNFTEMNWGTNIGEQPPLARVIIYEMIFLWRPLKVVATQYSPPDTEIEEAF